MSFRFYQLIERDLIQYSAPFSEADYVVTHTFGQLLPFAPQQWNPRTLRKERPDMIEAYDDTPSMYRCFENWHSRHANCYLYALGDPTLLMNRLSDDKCLGILTGPHARFRSAGNEIVRRKGTPETAIQVAQSDGLTFTGDKILWSALARPVALFVAPDYDYHWIRLDRTPEGMVWTHKTADTAPSIILDAKKNAVIDPRGLRFPLEGSRALPDPDYLFVGFFNVPRDLSAPWPVVERYLLAPEPRMLLEPEKAEILWKRGKGMKIPQVC